MLETAGVAAAVESISGKIYVGVCVDGGCTLGICAERNAIFNMLTNGEDAIKRVVAVNWDGEGYVGIGKDFLDLENLLVLSDDEGIFGCSMSDSARAMVTKDTKDILVVIYCFEDDIDLQELLNNATEAFQNFADGQNIKTWIV